MKAGKTHFWWKNIWKKLDDDITFWQSHFLIDQGRMSEYDFEFICFKISGFIKVTPSSSLPLPPLSNITTKETF